jgi:2-succinyl-5-enolpyruvyl-6-hydroxy-3-cyclohexene-1-carboxylate synthase
MSNHLSWTSTLLRSFYSSGVRHAVISPGSRSTPLTIAAAIHSGLHKQVVLDERSAAFIALGTGKATGVPAILICTSGTAVANYLPAVIEAKESGVPMIILSADRPPNLREIGSSQTIDQIKIFGDYAVFFHEAGEPQYGDDDLNRLTYLGRQAVEAAIENGGAAHINLPFRKPLQPGEPELSLETEKNERDIRSTRPPNQAVAKKRIYLSEKATKLFTSSEKPLIVAGPANPHHALNRQLHHLSEVLKAPIIQEPGCGIRKSEFSVHRYEQYLRSALLRNQLKPDLIIRFGDQPFTKSMLTVFEQWRDVPVFYLTARRYRQDYAMSVSYFIECSADDDIEWDLNNRQDNNQWLSDWKSTDSEYDSFLKKECSRIQKLTDGHVFTNLMEKIGEEWNIMLSNSLIPRDMALFSSARPQQFVNRGAAGIDGIISTAAGIHASTAKPTICITGDLAFLHDSNALLSLKGSDLPPFVILIVNNGGGTIFRMLPIYRSKEIYDKYFETPQDVHIESLAQAHNIKYRKITSLSELNVIDLKSMTGYNVIEIITDPDESMKLRYTLWNS